MNSKTFEIGREYSTCMICDSNCIIRARVLRRTAATVTMKIEGPLGGVKTLRIMRNSIKFFGCEAVKPLGTYSMAPTLTADDAHAA